MALAEGCPVGRRVWAEPFGTDSPSLHTHENTFRMFRKIACGQHQNPGFVSTRRIYGFPLVAPLWIAWRVGGRQGTFI
jgi:hypothetical protein